MWTATDLLWCVYEHRHHISWNKHRQRISIFCTRLKCVAVVPNTYAHRPCTRFLHPPVAVLHQPFTSPGSCCTPPHCLVVYTPPPLQCIHKPFETCEAQTSLPVPLSSVWQSGWILSFRAVFPFFSLPVFHTALPLCNAYPNAHHDYSYNLARGALQLILPVQLATTWWGMAWFYPFN